MKLLIDLIPAHARKWLYAVLSFALAVYTIVQAAGHDWKEAAVSLVSALVTTLATANTDVDLPVVEVDDDDLPADEYEGGYTSHVEAEQLSYDDVPGFHGQPRPIED